MVFDQVYHQLSIFELNIDICICLARYCHGSLPHFDYALPLYVPTTDLTPRCSNHAAGFSDEAKPG